MEKKNKYKELPFDLAEAAKFTVKRQANREALIEWNKSEAGVKNKITAGRLGGAVTRDSGHLASLRTPEHQSKAGKVSGDKHVESGHWKKVAEAGTKAASNKWVKVRLERSLPVWNFMKDDVWYTVDDLRKFNISETVIAYMRKNRLPHLFAKEFNGKGKQSRYKKVK